MIKHLVSMGVTLAGGLVLAACSPQTSLPVVPTVTAAAAASQAEPGSLRAAAEACGLVIGAAVRTDPILNDSQYQAVVSSEFSSITTENALKFRTLSAQPGEYNFQDADTIVNFAREHGMRVHGHTLVWHKSLPDWLTAESFTPDELVLLLERHIGTVVGRYRGQVSTWDVVNEAIDSEGKLRESIWRQALGDDYIAQAFRLAHDADPAAQLFYTDYDMEFAGVKSDAIYELVRSLVEAGVPINGVGFQLHLRLDHLPDMDVMQANMQRLTALGLQVQITEMDVRVQDVNGTPAEKLSRQAAVYGDMMRVCLQTSGCSAVNTWGFTDAYTWIPDYTGKPDMPLLFDTAYTPKPAYTALQAQLAACHNQN